MSSSPAEQSADELSASELSAMRRALALAATPGVPLGPNPRVGCVLLDDAGQVVAEGFHRGAGTAHAEADALAAAGEAARGTTAVVTLEPCNHTGRTGPCAEALIAAGVRRVVFAQADPNPVASGGAESLRTAGVDVTGGLLAAESAHLNRAWTHGLTHDRPFVTWKFATTLDGRSAAADGTSRWITNPASRLDVHRLRGECDVVLAGTGTVEVDDAELTVRDSDGEPLDVQPLRAVMGLRELAADLRVFNDRADTVRLLTQDPDEALRALGGLERHHVFLEGGPTLGSAFLRAGLVDEVIAYVAPVLLGAGAHSVAALGIDTIADALRLHVVDVQTIGAGPDTDIRLTLVPRRSGAPTNPHDREAS
ncbi:bifunctional diaminohydroxyphosphoribosylaminopyrimidine deaminase/5-amino-6-(5-phosphoribosylamino)uracil reductase RibD [Nocardioides gilvus]|uniref:bifunctional diaminohydroxyphosphoribosylaminopyrimidine deaminase/5-amino-6-(5-phosphoribosylamino)uracil reductase RibD n=1 Tax=Nocardioides gilvus TaxID=1735589 RepID=UPI001EF485C8|nr:bifunctional diaminohydroxyphosphoribosylaminopyrimidine deaminase/5-amino-6-(5-phosphoribosylamino)uracil reductase RibD [Nocardioides gilvus]